MTRLRLLLALIAGTLTLACSSGGTAPDPDEPFVGPPTQVSWFLYKSDQTITLVNDSHTNRLELYSTKRKSAGPKVATDLEMNALVDFFQEQDFDDFTTDGSAPVSGGALYSQAIELSVDGRPSYMLLSGASSQAERISFNRCAEALMTLWNLTYQVQAIDNSDGKEFFFEQPGANVRDKSR